MRTSQQTGFARGFGNLHLRNYCPATRIGCDLQNAPEGYNQVQQAAAVLDIYLDTVRHFGGTLQAVAAVSDQMLSQIREIRAAGQFEPENLEVLSESAVNLYKTLVPDSQVTPPSAAARTWWPLGIGFGLLALGLGIGIAVENSDSYRYRDRFRGNRFGLR